MVSAISFGWFTDFGKTVTIIQQSSQLVYFDKWKAPLISSKLEVQRCFSRKRFVFGSLGFY